MPYIGHSPTNAGRFYILDSLTMSSSTNYTMQVGGVDVTPNVDNLLITLDGVIQHAASAYTVSGSTLTFDSAPGSGVEFYGVVMGQSSSFGEGSIGADELKVTGDGSSGQVLASDGDGTFTWTTDTENYLPLAGGTMSGAINLGSQNVTNGGTITGTFVGNITGNVTGNTSGTAATVTTAAQTAITSVGTLTGLTVGGYATLERSSANGNVLYINNTESSHVNSWALMSGGSNNGSGTFTIKNETDSVNALQFDTSSNAIFAGKVVIPNGQGYTMKNNAGNADLFGLWATGSDYLRVGNDSGWAGIEFQAGNATKILTLTTTTATFAGDVTMSSATPVHYINSTTAGKSVTKYQSGGGTKGGVGLAGRFLGTSVTDMMIYAESGDGINFYTNGNSSNPPLVLGSDYNATFAGNISIGSTANFVKSGTTVAIEVGGSYNKFQLTESNLGSPKVTVDYATNNVGIGTDSPTPVGSGYTTVGLNGSNGSGISLQKAGSIRGYLYATNTDVYLQSANNNQVRISPNGSSETVWDTSGNVTFPAKVTAKHGNAGMLFEEYSSGAVLWLDGMNGDMTGGDYWGVHALNDGNFAISYAGSNKLSVTSSGVMENTGNYTCGNDFFVTGGRVDRTSNDRLYVQGISSGGVDLASGGGSVFYNGSSVHSSDETLKKNIAKISNSLDTISSLDGKSFKWKADTGRGDIKHYGVIAQDVEKILPELVITNDDEMSPFYNKMSVNYIELVPIMIEAIKELRAKVTELENA